MDFVSGSDAGQAIVLRVASLPVISVLDEGPLLAILHAVSLLPCFGLRGPEPEEAEWRSLHQQVGPHIQIPPVKFIFRFSTLSGEVHETHWPLLLTGTTS